LSTLAMMRSCGQRARKPASMQIRHERQDGAGVARLLTKLLARPGFRLRIHHHAAFRLQKVYDVVMHAIRNDYLWPHDPRPRCCTARSIMNSNHGRWQ
jgi:hypothetical protein